MKVLICGGRDFEDNLLLCDVLDEIHAETPITHVVTGGQRTGTASGDDYGADYLGNCWAIEAEINTSTHPAKWKKYGRSAGPRRNREMLDAHPDIALVVAFAGGRGTANMTEEAFKRGITVRTVHGSWEDRQEHLRLRAQGLDATSRPGGNPPQD